MDKIVVYIDKDLEDIVPMFLDSIAENITELNAAISENNFEFITRIGHNMKGSGGGYGFDKISMIGSLIEQAGKNKDKEPIPGFLSELSDYLKRVEIVYQQM